MSSPFSSPASFSPHSPSVPMTPQVMSPTPSQNPFARSPLPSQTVGASGSVQGSSSVAVQDAAVAYMCGHCGVENSIKSKDAVRCKECSYRIFYKKRTKRSTLLNRFFILVFLRHALFVCHCASLIYPLF